MIMNKLIISLALLLSNAALLKAQTGVNTRDPETSSILEVKSANKGLLLPRLTIPLTANQGPIPTATAIADGLLAYNISANVNAAIANPTLYFWSVASAAWQRQLYFKETPKVAVFGINADRTVLDNVGRGEEETLTNAGTKFKMINSGYLPGLSFTNYGNEVVIVGSGTYVLEISYLITAPPAVYPVGNDPAVTSVALQNGYYSMGYFSDLFVYTYNSNTNTFFPAPVNDSRVEGGVLSKTDEPHRIRFLHTFDLPNTSASYALDLYIGRRDGSSFNDKVTVLANGTIIKLTKLK